MHAKTPENLTGNLKLRAKRLAYKRRDIICEVRGTRLLFVIPSYKTYPCQKRAKHTNLNLLFVDPCILVQFIKKIQQDAIVYQNFIITYLYEAQHVSGDTLPIIRSLKLHWQPLVFHTWKVVGCVVGELCQTHCA
jgi:hypothetical protein